MKKRLREKVVEKDNKKKKIKKKLTKEDYISTIVGCFITFFIVNIVTFFLDKSSVLYTNSTAFLIGFLTCYSLLPTILATTITLFSRSSIIGIGIIALFYVQGGFYGIFRDIYNMPILTASTYATYIFLLVTIFGVGICWVIKKLLIRR